MMNRITNSKSPMKVVVIGGTGLIGTKVVRRLREKGHDVVAASPTLGVKTSSAQ